LLTVSLNLRGLASEHAAQPAKEGRSLARSMRSLGVNVRRVACLLEPGPLAHLLSFGFLRPADKCRLAAGHGELPEVIETARWRAAYHGSRRGKCEVRHTRRKKFHCLRPEAAGEPDLQPAKVEPPRALD
jgi:hypothetical protein